MLPGSSHKRGIALILTILLPVFAITCAGDKNRRQADKSQYDVIVVGAGLGGLSAAAHLASGKLRVLVLEQHDKVGGCATKFSRGEFTFDTSLHEIDGSGPRRPGRKREPMAYHVMRLCGVDKKIKLIEHANLYRVKTPDIDITLPANWAGLKDVLKKRWPAESEGIDRFHEICDGVQEDAMSLGDLFRCSTLKRIWKMAQVPFRQSNLFRWRNKTVKDLMDHCFRDENIKTALSQYCVYFGPPPADQSALLFICGFTSYVADGSWHIKGTGQALSDAYAERIRELGGEVKTGVLVKKIIMENDRAVGVETAAGDRYSSRYVVTNTDPFQLVYTLIGENHFPERYVKKIRGMKPANSLFGVYLGLNIDLKKSGYTDYEIFYSSGRDQGKMYRKAMAGDYDNCSVAITIYTNMDDPVYAPAGKSVVKLDTYSDIGIWPQDEQAYRKMKDAKVDELIRLASQVIPELADPANIAVKIGYTPRTIQRYTLNKDGVVYGFAFTPEQFFRIPVTTPIDNVFITGNWTQIAHGFSGVQVSGWHVARLVMEREGIEHAR